MHDAQVISNSILKITHIMQSASNFLVSVQNTHISLHFLRSNTVK